MDNKDRITGALLGFAVGDTMGATTEFMEPEQIKEQYGKVTEILGGGWLDIEPGQITDDTEMMLCVARSLVATKGEPDYKDMADRLVEWWQDDPIDVGHACRAGLFNYAKNGSLCNGDNESLGNGGLLRVLPFALAGRDWREAANHSALTHGTSAYIRSVQSYVCMIHEATTGSDKYGVRDAIHGVRGMPKVMNGGMVKDTLKSATEHFMMTDSFEDCIVRAVNAGNDADSVAAIAGGLAGAYYGVEAIPAKWLFTLDSKVRQELLELGTAFAEMRQES